MEPENELKELIERISKYVSGATERGGKSQGYALIIKEACKDLERYYPEAVSSLLDAVEKIIGLEMEAPIPVEIRDEIIDIVNTLRTQVGLEKLWK